AGADGEAELVPRSRLPQARLWAPVALLDFTGLYLLLFENISPGRILHGYGGRGFTLAERLLTESRVVVHYLSLLLYPELSRFRLE
ncbi:MAG: hypothetical protein P1P81_11700, partial [Desulfobulbales bacterium]|nr:hypothetical protein [Desulfobulbales bacterium]